MLIHNRLSKQPQPLRLDGHDPVRAISSLRLRLPSIRIAHADTVTGVSRDAALYTVELGYGQPLRN